MNSESFKKHLPILIAAAVIAVLFSMPLFAHLDYWGIQDWDAFLARSSVSRASLLQYGQFPLWNPYSMGGMPHLAQPETNILSLPFLCELIFGVLLGNRINIVLHLFIGLTGAYYLARHYRLSLPASALVAFVFMLSSMYTLPVTMGMVSAYAIGYMPWAFLFYLKAHDDIAHALAAAGVLALMWLAGGIYPFCLTVLFFGTYSGLAVVFGEYRIKTAAKALCLIGVLSFLLGAVKFLPSIEFTSQFPRESDLYCGFSLEALTYGLFARDQTIAAINDKGSEPGFLHGFTHNIDEIGMYIGLLPFALFLIGFCCRLKRYRVLASCLLLFLWLAFGYRSEPLSLWALVHKIPPYNIMRTAERFRYVFLLCLSLFAGLGLQALSQWLTILFRSERWSNRIAYVVTALVLVDLFVVCSPVSKDAFLIPPLPIPANESFIQMKGFQPYDINGIVTPDSNDNYQSFGAEFPAFLANAGTVVAYESMPLPTKAIPIGSPDYRGEVFLSGTEGTARYRLWSPNRLIVEVKAQGEGFVVVNQNFYKNWHAKGGPEPVPVNGLLAVKVNPQISTVELYYLPTTFVVGAILSAGSLTGMLCWLLRRRRKARLADGGPTKDTLGALATA